MIPPPLQVGSEEGFAHGTPVLCARVEAAPKGKKRKTDAPPPTVVIRFGVNGLIDVEVPYIYIYVCVCVCVCVYLYLYLYIYIEREREIYVYRYMYA